MHKSGAIRPPLLKWPGGKRALLAELIPLVPGSYGRFFEPFLGGGALFFALCPDIAHLADNNSDLINCYIQVRDHPDDVIACLSRWDNTERDYYIIRASEPLDDIARAARLIYLSTLSFNGIHRVNLRGKFNVPYGRKQHLRPCDPDKIYQASDALGCAKLTSADFEVVVREAKKGDFVYFDPPYTVAHGSNGFLKYNARIFSWQDQVRLAAIACELAGRGCYVLVSNADYPSIENLYTGFHMKKISRPSVIAASREFRRPVTECVFASRSVEEICQLPLCDR